MADIRCTKMVPRAARRTAGYADCGNPAAEVLLVAPAEARPRCKDHPAEGDLPLLRRLKPGAAYAILSLDGARTGQVPS